MRTIVARRETNSDPAQPSKMPMAYARPLSDGAAARPGDVKPRDSMCWQFYVGTLDAAKKTRENQVFLIATDPSIDGDPPVILTPDDQADIVAFLRLL